MRPRWHRDCDRPEARTAHACTLAEKPRACRSTASAESTPRLSTPPTGHRRDLPNRHVTGIQSRTRIPPDGSGWVNRASERSWSSHSLGAAAPHNLEMLIIRSEPSKLDLNY